VNLLLTGGAGYIGSVLAVRLISAGHDVTVLDDLSTGRPDSVPAEVRLVHADVRAAGHFFRDHHVDAVLHLAAKSLLEDSVADPHAYWQNLDGMVALLEAMHSAKVWRIVFSFASADRIRAYPGWQAERDLDAMAADAWAFTLTRSSGATRSQRQP
jgi:UDP-glucose 4-epimerase